MEKATFMGVSYKRPVTRLLPKDSSVIDEYTKDGFEIQKDNGNSVVLEKPSRVWVTLQSPKCGVKKFNIVKDICRYYKKEKITLDMVIDFYEDVQAGRITFKMSSDSYSFE